MARHAFALLTLLVLAAACAPTGPPAAGVPATSLPAQDPAPAVEKEQQSEVTTCADVVDVETSRSADGTYRFDVTVRSGDTGWDKYADEWRITTLDGAVLGTRVLAHPHEDEQPFTRSLSGVGIPAGVGQVEVAARDSVAGYCGATVTVAVPSS